MNFFGGEIGSAIEGEQIMTLKKDERFESLAALELTKDAGESWTEKLGIDVIKDGAHLGVGGNLLEAEERFEIPLVASPLLVKGQERRFFESEDGKARHEGVA